VGAGAGISRVGAPAVAVVAVAAVVIVVDGPAALTDAASAGPGEGPG